jgi:hypothetical protein
LLLTDFEMKELYKILNNHFSEKETANVTWLPPGTDPVYITEKPKEEHKLYTLFLSRAVRLGSKTIAQEMNEMFHDYKDQDEDVWVDEWQVIPLEGGNVQVVMKICWTEKVEDK